MADENITLRKKHNILFTSFSESSLFNATVRSMPDTSLHDDETIAKLHEEINSLRINLQSANQEIDNLLCANMQLKSDLDKSNQVIQLYKKVGTGEAKCPTPGSKQKPKTKLKLGGLTSTPVKKSLEIKSFTTTPKETLNKETQTDNLTAQTHKLTSTSCSNNSKLTTEELTKDAPKVKQKNKLCILSSYTTKRTLSTIEDVFAEHFNYCHYVMPNSTLKELVSDLEQKLKDFTFNDYCIILIGENDLKKNRNHIDVVNSLKESLQKITHTNKIVCVPTYIKGALIYNFQVEMFNNLLCMDLQNNDYAYFFDSNQTLSHEMFSYKTGKVNNNGTRHIYNQIMINIMIDLCAFNQMDKKTNNTNLGDCISDYYDRSPKANANFFRVQ